MIIEVDTASAVPPYEQIRLQIETMVATGVLARDTRLPTIRQLAADLGLAPGTVSRAYRELELSGTVVSRVRHGTRVAAEPPTFARAEVRAKLRDAARSFTAAAQQLGASDDEVLTAVTAALAQRAKEPTRTTS